MVRANGVLLMTAALYPLLSTIWRHGEWRPRALAVARCGAAIVVGFVLATMATMLLHLAIAYRAMPPTWRAATIDAPFVAPSYQAYIEGRRPLTPRIAWSALDGYRRFMAADVAGVGLTDTNASRPWLWPLGRRPIVYEWDSTGATTSAVALAPNLAAWAISLLGVAGALALLVRVALGSDERQIDDRLLTAALLATWAIFCLSDLLLAQVRVMYLYHYFPPLVIGWVLAAVVFGRRCRHRHAGLLANGTLILVLLGFMLVSPVALHHPLTDRACRMRMILNDPSLCDRMR